MPDRFGLSGSVSFCGPVLRAIFDVVFWDGSSRHGAVLVDRYFCGSSVELFSFSYRSSIVIQQNKNEAFETSSQAVLVTHGLGSHWLLMLPLVWKLRRSGFKAFNYGYRSFFKTVPQHADLLLERLRKLDQDDAYTQVHIVAHSLGAIITRQALLQLERSGEKLGKLQRIVMLSPPNEGSSAAERLSYLVPLSQTVQQISNRNGSFVRAMDEPTSAEIGIVEASYDFVVPESTVQLSTQTDHVCIFSGHNGLLVRPTAAKQVVAFLKDGKFCKA